jgi:hypothetical protein
MAGKNTLSIARSLITLSSYYRFLWKFIFNPRAEMISKLEAEVNKWQKADSSLIAIPALHYIAVTAQGAPGRDNMHRMRMPFKQIDTVLSWAKPIKALVFLDIQVGHSTVKAEVPELEKYLALPNVHLGIDPEFSLKNGEIPGSKIGSFSAEDINDAIDFLANVVRKNKLPPKVLIVHRFTQGMVTNYKKIKTGSRGASCHGYGWFWQ